MTSAWIVAFVALWLLVLVIAVIVLGTVRGTTQLLEAIDARLHVLQMSEESSGLAPGDPVPAFEAEDRRGRRITDQDLQGEPFVLLFLDDGCAPCDTIMGEMQRLEGRTATRNPIDVRLYIVRQRQQASDLDDAGPLSEMVLYQRERQVALAFRSLITPHAFVVDSSMVVVGRSVPQSLNDLERLLNKFRFVRNDERSTATQRA